MRAMQTARDRLVPHAFALKKTWLIAVIMRGYKPIGDEAIIPNYTRWPRRDLQRVINDLEDDIVDAFRPFLTKPKDALRVGALTWLSDRFDEWLGAGMGLFTISTAQDFERRVGRLTAHRELDVPPYTELLLQPGNSMAFRHPEYMLARDLAFLYELFREAEDLLRPVNWGNPPRWAQGGSENSQSLARTVVLTCFNLVESFVSGLARAFVMEHPELDDETKAYLLDTRAPLRKRILGVPRAITPRTIDLDINKEPLSRLMGPIKARRDAFVHCEPGPAPSERGYVKEILFHDVGVEVVEECVVTTMEIIRTIWYAVHQRLGPRWLPERLPTGHFPGYNLHLATVEQSDRRLTPR